MEEVFQRWGVIWEMAVAGRVLRTTAEHPFWVRGRGWTAASQLRVGDALRSHDGQWLAVESVRDTGREEAVYNCRVAEYHTYFVGDQQWGFSLWAHNSCGPANASGRSSYTLIDQGNPAVAELRRRYLGETPRRGSPTYRAVVERMQSEGYIRLNQTTGQLELRGQIKGAEVWRPLSSRQINMGHRVDAVLWWNETGRFLGARSPQAREFMLNPDNYILQFEEVNKSLGATLRHQGNAYLRPPIASLRIVE